MNDDFEAFAFYKSTKMMICLPNSVICGHMVAFFHLFGQVRLSQVLVFYVLDGGSAMFLVGFVIFILYRTFDL